MIHRGEVLLAYIPFVIGSGGKDRPVVVVQSDRNNNRLPTTVVVGFSTNIGRRGLEPTQFLIDPATPDGRSSGLGRPSVAKCENIFNIPMAAIRRPLGRLSPPLMHQLDQCLKAALDLP
jgi:mRNA-degrading endonuclease toxin of MazEF toxin-antitoxin module